MIPANGIEMHVAEAGEGPLVLLCHGWPELWYSWRHQLAALAEAGFHAVAPDMRGFGRTDAPDDVAAYTILHIVGDMVALVEALGETRAVIVGHDWGAPVAWHAALMRPDIFIAVAGLSVPHRRRGLTPPLETLPRPPASPTTTGSISRSRASPRPSSSATRATRSAASSISARATRRASTR